MLPLTRLAKYIHYINYRHRSFSSGKYYNEKLVLLNHIQYYNFIIVYYKQYQYSLNFMLKIKHIYYQIGIIVFHNKIDRINYLQTKTSKLTKYHDASDTCYSVSVLYRREKICNIILTNIINKKESAEKSIVSKTHIDLTDKNYRTDMFNGIHKKIMDNNKLVFLPKYYKILHN